MHLINIVNVDVEMIRDFTLVNTVKIDFDLVKVAPEYLPTTPARTKRSKPYA